MTFTRFTLRETVEFEGLGLHGGQPVRVRVHPGSDGLFFRTSGGRWEAIPANVTDTTRSTKLGEVATIEHLMSAFAGLEITDAEIEVEGGEMPALDGSAQGFVEGMLGAGLEELGAGQIEPLFKRVFFHEEPIKIAIGKGEGHWKYLYDLDGRWPGVQEFESYLSPETYAREIAPARTFALVEEVPQILEFGLAKGLDQETALILGIEGYKNEARFEDEPARHKLLDLIGDLYLSGVPVRLLNVAAERSGHATNVRAAALLREHVFPVG